MINKKAKIEKEIILLGKKMKKKNKESFAKKKLETPKVLFSGKILYPDSSFFAPKDFSNLLKIFDFYYDELTQYRENGTISYNKQHKKLLFEKFPETKEVFDKYFLKSGGNFFTPAVKYNFNPSFEKFLSWQHKEITRTEDYEFDYATYQAAQKLYEKIQRKAKYNTIKINRILFGKSSHKDEWDTNRERAKLINKIKKQEIEEELRL